MITVHHLNNSRSQRVLWLLEELGVPYEVKRYERDKKTNLAPPELLKIHPLGKSPVIDNGGSVFAETGAIIEYVLETFGNGRLAPPKGSPEYWRYKYWLHAAEGSYMPPLVMSLVFSRIETAPMPFFAKPIAKSIAKRARSGYVGPTLNALLDYLDAELSKSPWIAGAEFSAADIIMSFPVEAALARVEGAKSRRHLEPYVKKLHARPAFGRALARGGPYLYA